MRASTGATTKTSIPKVWAYRQGGTTEIRIGPKPKVWVSKLTKGKKVLKYVTLLGGKHIGTFKDDIFEWGFTRIVPEEETLVEIKGYPAKWILSPKQRRLHLKYGRGFCCN